MVSPVTDPLLLQQLEGSGPAAASGPQPVTDPLLLRQLESTPDQMTGIARTVALPASNVAKGFTDLVAMPGEAVNSAVNLYSRYAGAPLANLYGRLTGSGQTTQPWNISNPWDTAHLEDTATRAGIINRPDLTPQNDTERYIAAGAQGVGGAVPLALATGGASALLPAAIQGAGAGVGGEFGAGWKDHPILGRTIGSILGGVGAGTATSAVANVGGKAINAAQGNTSPLVDAYREAGIDPVLAGDVTGNRFLRGAQAYASKAPGGGKVGEAAGNAVNQFGESVEKTAQNLGDSTTLQEAGSALQKYGQGWLDQFKTQGQKLWSAVGDKVAPTDRVSIANYDDALSKIGKTLADAPETAKQLQPALSRNLFESLQKDAGSDGTLSWQSVKGIRTRIGEMLSNPQLIADTDTAELKRLYSALSEDMQTHVQGVGPEAVNAFNAASNFTKQGHAVLDGGMGQILKKGVKPEDAAQYALSSSGKGGTILQTLRDQVPEAADELAAFKLRDMADANSGNQNATHTVISPGKFVTQLNKLSPEAQRALFSDPTTARKIEALGTVGHSMKTTEAMANHSGTGPYHSMAGALGLTEAVPAAWAGYELGGIPGAIASGVSGVAAPFLPGMIAGRLSATPWLTRALATPGGAAPQLLPAPLAGTSGLLSAPRTSGLLTGP